MYITLTFKEDKTIEHTHIFANGVHIGFLCDAPIPNTLLWHTSTNANCIKFALRKESTFREILKQLKQYKNKHGYQYILIYTDNMGIASFYTKEFLYKQGFVQIDGYDPTLYFLE